MGLACAGARDGHAQAIRLDVRAVPLAEALASLSDQAGVDVVYAQRLVSGRRATCRYVGTDAVAALACVLRETGLRADFVREGQYVLVAEDDAAEKPLPVRLGTLSGFVIDGETGEVLPGAHVYLVDRGVGTITNEAGYFALPAVSITPHRVRVSYLGYHVVDTLLVMETMTATVALHPVTIRGEELVVEARRENVPDLDEASGAVAFPVSRLETLPSSLGGQDLFQALEWMPGVQRAGEVTGGLIVRGSGLDQNLYLLDGAPVYHPWHAFSLVSTFQTDTFKDIKLYQGAFPAEHGGRLSAVLDAELKDGNRRQPHVVAALNALNGRFVIESPITKNSSFMIAGRRSYLDKLIGRTHPVVDEGGRRDTLRTGYYFYDWNAKVSFRPGTRSRFTLSFYTGRDILDLRLPFDLSLDFSSWLRPADLFFEVDQRWGNTLYSARYQYLASRRVYVTVTGYDSRYEAAEGTLIQPTSSASVVSDYGVRLHDVGLKVDVDYYRSLAHRVRAGVRVVDHRFRSDLDAVLTRSPGTVDTVDERSRQRDLEVIAYAQDVWKPAPRWQIRPGVRLSFFSGGAYMRLDPRLSLQYEAIPERLLFRANAGTQVQYVQRLRDRFSFLYDLVSSRWIPAGTGVRPARGGEVSLGLESRPGAWLTVTMDAYGRAARRVLLPRDEFQTKDGLEGPGIEVGTLLGQYVTGRERSYGVEATIRAERGAWQLWVSYAAGRSLNRAPELGETDYRPTRYDVPSALRSVLRWEKRRWWLALSALWRSGYPVTVPVARYVLAGPLDEAPTAYLYRPRINNGRLPAYLRLDVTAAYRFGWLGARWQAEVHLYNALNRRNVIGRFYDPAEEVVRGKDRRGLPLLPLFEFKMEL